MTKKIFYEKVGRKYVPVSEYDSDLSYALPKGAHLVLVYPGGSSTRYNVDENYAALIAAGRIAEETISRRMMEASEIRRQQRGESTPLTPGQKAAWENLVKEFGDSAKQLEWPSAREISEAAVQSMVDEADKLMQNESVRQAFDHFQFLCKLTKENQDGS